MTKKEFEKIADILKGYYRDKTFTGTVAAIYWEKWRNYSYSTIYRAVMDVLQEVEENNRVPSLKTYEPFIERYHKQYGPVSYPPHIKRILEEDRVHVEMPFEVRRWNIHLLNVIVKAILEKKNVGDGMTRQEYLSKFAEKLVLMWLKRGELEQQFDLQAMNALRYSVFIEVIQKVDEELARLVDEALRIENDEPF